LTRDRFAYIDSLRAVAALMVIALHTSEFAQAHFVGLYIEGFISNIVLKFDFGRAGVVLFFAISGFVIPSSLKPDDPVAVFPVRRFFRLFPAYWLSIVTGLAVLHWAFGDYPAHPQIIANATMLHRFWGEQDLMGIYWTLQVEIAFYVLCFLFSLVRILDNGGVLAALAFGLGLYWYVILATGLGLFQHLAFLRLPDSYNAEWFAYLSIMFLGASCRSILRGDRSGLMLTCLTGILWLVVQPLTGLMLYLHETAKEFVALKYGAYGVGLWIFFLFGFVVKIHSRTIAWLGRISYSLYLQHPIVLYGLFWITLRLKWSPPLTAGTWVALVAIGSIGVAAFVFHFVEAPCIGLSNKLTRRLAARARTAALTREIERNA
jgi:peptidoglycan/LPS O-acetylase OafA/YrhL